MGGDLDLDGYEIGGGFTLRDIWNKEETFDLECNMTREEGYIYGVIKWGLIWSEGCGRIWWNLGGYEMRGDSDLGGNEMEVSA